MSNVREQTVSALLKRMREENFKMADFRMVDFSGRLRHVTVPASQCSEKLFESGIGFDASNYGYATVEKSDMVFIPDPETAFEDPFAAVKTLSVAGNVYTLDGKGTGKAFGPYPRQITLAAESYLRATGVADELLLLPEFEFYLFDEVSWKVSGRESFYRVDSANAHWNEDVPGIGTVVPRQGNYHASMPEDSAYDLRSEMCLEMEKLGIPVKYHHPEVGSAGQFEIETQLRPLSVSADQAVLIKYIVRNTAARNGKAATFMPKPVYGEAGSGMHVHMQLRKDGKNLFSDDAGYAHLSDTALYFIGGLLTHVNALCALTNPSTNSYRRLVPGFEAPVTAGYAQSNRSAVIRIPGYIRNPEDRRFEIRNPDATCNPYFAFSAILMAGLDGVLNRIDPRNGCWGPFDCNLYKLPAEQKKRLRHLPASLPEALDALESDRGFLTAGNVFPDELLDAWILSRRQEYADCAQIPTPAEFRSSFQC